MYYKFFVKGYLFNGKMQEEMKRIARRVSHRVPGANDSGLSLGPVRFEYRGRIEQRSLTKRETVFGMASPSDRNGGFAGLVSWRGYPDENGCTVVSVDIARATLVGASEWIVDFVRQCIVQAGWAIEDEEMSIVQIAIPQSKESDDGNGN